MFVVCEIGVVGGVAIVVLESEGGCFAGTPKLTAEYGANPLR